MTNGARVQLTRHGRAVSAVFSLLGQQENDLTAALGWTLARSPRLLTALLNRVDLTAVTQPLEVHLEARRNTGRTDLEIHAADAVVIIEAKRGWQLPTPQQLEQYAPRLDGVPHGRLLTLSDCSAEWAHLKLPSHVSGVEVRHLPWSAITADLRATVSGAGGHERLWLDQLSSYLKEALRVTEVDSAEVYCVSVNNDRPGSGGARTFREFVDDGIYFYPYGWGGGWPTIPPNFLAFRWAGHVQQVRRVLDYEVIATLQDRWPDIPRTEGANLARGNVTDLPHVVCRLGPPLRMEPLPTGKNIRATRIWVLLDQLLTADTLMAAHSGSRRLRGEIPVDQDDTPDAGFSSSD